MIAFLLFCAWAGYYTIVTGPAFEDWRASRRGRHEFPRARHVHLLPPAECHVHMLPAPSCPACSRTRVVAW